MRGCPALTDREVKATWSNLRGRYRWRDRALLILGVRSGLRISELLSLRVDQVWDGQTVRPRFYVQRRHAKGRNQGACLVVHPEAARALTRWLQERASMSPTDHVFSSQLGAERPLDRRHVWRIFNRALRAAGVVGMAGTHCMRKTFAKNVHEALGGDLFRLSKALRHASPMTTLAYLSFKQEEIDEAILAA